MVKKVKICMECGEKEETPVVKTKRKEKYYFFPTYWIGVYATNMQEAKIKVEELRKKLK